MENKLRNLSDVELLEITRLYIRNQLSIKSYENLICKDKKLIHKKLEAMLKINTKMINDIKEECYLDQNMVKLFVRDFNHCYDILDKTFSNMNKRFIKNEQ